MLHFRIEATLRQSYGMFHAQVRPNKLYGIVTTGISFQGLNMDIGHLRHIRWVKDDDPQSAVNNKPELTQNGKTAAQNRWIAYNKMRGQYASAMEHAVPEKIWVDKTNCRFLNERDEVVNPLQSDCAQAISAVKAIAIAQAEGQRIYIINKSNAATALATLPVGGTVGQEIYAAVQAGKEVTVHERPITAHGWSGYGYVITDPETGAGAFLIEGKGRGGWLGCGTDSFGKSMEAICAFLETHDVPRDSANWHDLDRRNAEHFWFAYEMAQLIGPFGFLLSLS